MTTDNEQPENETGSNADSCSGSRKRYSSVYAMLKDIDLDFANEFKVRCDATKENEAECLVVWRLKFEGVIEQLCNRIDYCRENETTSKGTIDWVENVLMQLRKSKIYKAKMVPSIDIVPDENQ